MHLTGRERVSATVCRSSRFASECERANISNVRLVYLIVCPSQAHKNVRKNFLSDRISHIDFKSLECAAEWLQQSY